MWIIVVLESKASTGGAGIIGLACLISPIYNTVRYADYCAHKQQVNVSQIVYVGHEADTDSPYFNASDKLQFKLHVEFKNYDVKNVKIDTLVYEDNSYLGALCCEFEGDKIEHIDYGASYADIPYFEKHSVHDLAFSYRYSGTHTDDLYYYILEKGHKLTYKPSIPMVWFKDDTIVGSFQYHYDDAGIIQWDTI